MSATPRIKTSMLALALAMTPFFAEAAGLGRLNVLSGLGQPLRGEIELVSVAADEAESLAASLASADAFSAAGLSYPSSSLGVRVALEQRGSGSYVLLLSSSQAINEPIVDLLVDLRWATGQVRRGYSALLDPVGYGNPSSAPATNAAKPAADAVASPFDSAAKPAKANLAAAVESPKSSKKSDKRSRKAVVAPVEQKPMEKAAVDASAPATQAAAADAYTIKSGDTLSSIGRKLKPEGVSLEQVLVGLYRNNQSAFSGNMNLLKKGKILQLPDTQKLQSVSKAEAAKEILAQSENWQTYRQQLGESVKKAPGEKGDQAASGGRITAKVEDKGATTSDRSKDVLKLSSGTDKKGASTEQARVKALEEEVASRKKSLDEANQRVTELQKNIKKMEDLAAVKSRSGAELQNKSAEATSAQPTVAPTLAPTVIPTIAVASEVASAPVITADASAASVAEVASAPVATPKPRAVVRPTPVPEPEPSFLDSVMDNALLVGGGVLVAVLGVGAFIFSRRRRQPSLFENSIITGGDLKPNTVIGRTGGGVISTQAENSFLTDFSRQGFGSVDTDEVDPIAEADVYMAYGRDAQAEEILKDALAKDKQRHEVRVKLLDIYAARKDKVAFEEVASDLYTMTGGLGPHWEHAVHLGRGVDPANPLYARGGDGKSESNSFNAPAAAVVATAAVAGISAAVKESVPAPVAAPDLDFSLDLDKAAAPAVTAKSEPNPSVLDTELLAPSASGPVSDIMLDFDFSAPALAAKEESSGLMSLDLPVDIDQAEELEAGLALDTNSVLDDLDLSLELGSADSETALDSISLTEAADVQPIAAVEAQELDEALDLDFGFDLNETESVSTASLAVDASAGDLDLGLGDAGEDFPADDPVQTKIDLARAYIDMGDVEGAREILQEAVQEGNSAQQGVARGMLSEL